jgi:hypothetical protein
MTRVGERSVVALSSLYFGLPSLFKGSYRVDYDWLIFWVGVAFMGIRRSETDEPFRRQTAGFPLHHRLAQTAELDVCRG